MNAKLTNIETFAEGTISLIKEGADMYRTVVSYMDAVEELGVLKGEQKLIWVLAKLAEVIVNYEANRAAIIRFIESVKAAYNQVKSLFA